MSSFPHKKSAHTINPSCRSRSSRLLLPSRSASQEGASSRRLRGVLLGLLLLCLLLIATHRRTRTTALKVLFIVVEGVLEEDGIQSTDRFCRLMRREASNNRDDEEEDFSAAPPKRRARTTMQTGTTPKNRNASRKKKRRKPLERH